MKDTITMTRPTPGNMPKRPPAKAVFAPPATVEPPKAATVPVPKPGPGREHVSIPAPMQRSELRPIDPPKGVNYGESADGSVQVTFQIVTPQLAYEWLRRNVENRSLSEPLANTYATDMTTDQWWLNTDAIGFDSQGALMNGQHRLSGVVLSGKSVEMMVVYGLDPRARATADIGRKRTVADELRMRGVHSSSILASAVRLRIQYENNTVGLPLALALTNQDIIAWVEVWQDEFQDSLVRARAVAGSLTASPSMLTCAYSIFKGIDKDLADHMYAKLATGEMLEGTLLALYRKFQSNSVSITKLSTPHTLWMMIRAWNALRKGEALTRFIIPEIVTGTRMLKAI